ncbi:MAG: 1-(5-phosphoribosyl)-5-[(5-phosphoribosylamino)methylideneamino]imidazole-4-carboxamide isomerase [Terriglobia bacterium]
MKTKMVLYPAIDVKDGKCVRLVQGRAERVKEYSRNPVQTALHWEREGAEWLHVVDLDAALSESHKNEEVVEEILRVVRIPVQLGGGMRSLARIEKAIAIGASRVVIGTAAVENYSMLHQAIEQFGDYLAVGIDVRDEHVATRGWKLETDSEPKKFAKNLALHGINVFVVTDIAQDGMLSGPNYALAEGIARVTKGSVILSGGIGSLDDLIRARTLANRGIDGVIVGKALYEAKFTLKEALAATSRS